MEEKDIKNLLEPLKSVEPNENWVISCRSKLAFRIEMERKKHLLDKDFSVLRGLFSFLENKPSRFAAKWAYALSIGFLVVASGGGATAWAAKHSLPGSALYSVKIAMEKIRLQASLSSEGKIRLQAQMTDMRLNELQKVVQSSEDPEKKKEKVEQVVNQISQQLSKANNQLPKMASVESAKNMASAKVINESAVKAEKMLSQMKEALPSELKENLGDKLAQTAETADRASSKALEIIVKSQTGPTDNSLILATIREKIELTQEKVNVISQKAENVSSSTIADNAVGGNFIADKLPITRAVLIKDQSEKAQELIEQAKISLESNDMTQALETINLAKTIILGAEKMADSDLIRILSEEGVIKDSIETDTGLNQENSASSTVPAGK